MTSTVKKQITMMGNCHGVLVKFSKPVSLVLMRATRQRPTPMVTTAEVRAMLKMVHPFLLEMRWRIIRKMRTRPAAMKR